MRKFVWENPVHQGTQHNSQVKTTIIYIICDITTDTIKNTIVLHAYCTNKIETFDSVRFINRQHDYSYIFLPYIIIHNVEVEYCDSKFKRIYETWQRNGMYIWYLITEHNDTLKRQLIKFIWFSDEIFLGNISIC